MPLYAIVGKMRQGKSYFAVKTTKELNDTNTKNIHDNFKTFQENEEILESRGDFDKLSPFQALNTIDQFPEYFDLSLQYKIFIEEYNAQHNLKLPTLKPVRQIYSDIKGLKIANVLPALDDWRDTPRGSITFYDEVQDREPYRYAGNMPSKDPMILDIAKIGHNDRDLYLITQDADNYHKSLRKIFDKLYLVKRPPQNFECCSVYTFDTWLSNPRAAADSPREPKKYINYQLIPYKKEIQRLYESASSHESIRKYLPKKWFVYGAIILCVLALVIYSLAKLPIFQSFYGAIKMMMGQDTGTLNDVLKPQLPAPSASDPVAKTPEQSKIDEQIKTCIDSKQMTQQQCIEAYDPRVREKRHAELEQSTGNNMEQIVIKYSSSDPFNYSYDAAPAPVHYRVFSGCAKNLKGELFAYDRQGTIIHDVQNDVCKRVLAGDRPFNPYKLPDPPLPAPVPTEDKKSKSISEDDLKNYLAEYLQSQRSVGEQQQINPETSPL